MSGYGDQNKFPHCFTVGDVLPEIVVVYERADLTGYTIVLRLMRPDGIVIVKNAIMIAIDKFSFKFLPTDLIAGIGQQSEIVFTTPLGEQLTSPVILLNVKDQI